MVEEAPDLHEPLKLSQAASILGVSDPQVMIRLVQWGVLATTREPDGSYRTTLEAIRAFQAIAVNAVLDTARRVHREKAEREISRLAYEAYQVEWEKREAAAEKRRQRRNRTPEERAREEAEIESGRAARNALAKTVLELRYQGLTLREIGTQLIGTRSGKPLSAERVRQIEGSALRKLRHPSRVAQMAQYEQTGIVEW